MKRNIDLKDISDGKLYGLNDMVKADCNGCKDCSACCRGMGQSIILDPFDMNRLIKGLGMTFEQLLGQSVELNVVDGLILPNLSMKTEDHCFYLNGEGRCSIHELRPGICRLFPLGRFYDKDDYQYFLQIHECRNSNRSKIKVKKYLGEQGADLHHKFILDWHDFVIETQEKLFGLDEELVKKTDIFILQHFFIEPYQGENFYHQFEQRLKKAKEIIKTYIG